jgi:hypothetical protein
MRLCTTLCCGLLIATLAIGQGERPKRVPVPDSATAVKIAEAALLPVYGKKKIDSEGPFTAQLKNDVWTVSGTLHCSDGKGGSTTRCVGGVAVVQISKVDGRILSMAHYK